MAGGNRSLDRSGWEIVNGTAWGSDFAIGGGLEAGNQLVRLDLKTGAVQVWMTKPNEVGVTLLGIDTQGEVLVHLFVSYYTSESPPPAQPSQVLVLSAPDTGKVVYENTDPNASLPGTPWFADANGVWFSSPAAQAVWLYVAQSGFRAVSVPLTGAYVSVGGACV